MNDKEVFDLLNVNHTINSYKNSKICLNIKDLDEKNEYEILRFVLYLQYIKKINKRASEQQEENV